MWPEHALIVTGTAFAMRGISSFGAVLLLTFGGTPYDAALLSGFSPYTRLFLWHPDQKHVSECILRLLWKHDSFLTCYSLRPINLAGLTWAK